MMNTLSFMTANYVARQVGYHMTEGWMQGDRSSNEYFQPIATFRERLGEYLSDIRKMGFEALDIWTGVINPQWATPEHIAGAQELLAQHKLKVTSLAGGFGATPQEVANSCNLAVSLGTNLLGGGVPLLKDNRPAVVDTLKKYAVRLGIENHPEKTPQELLDKIGDGANGVIGAAVDTGWFGTQGFDAAQALEALRDHLLLVHLKDVTHAGAHETCALGKGVVPVEGCVRALKRMGYGGAISIEHEPELYDPTPDCIESLARVRQWLAD